MTRNLWCASLHDPFYCSNIGATLKPLGKLRPLAWEYDSKGLPRILIAKHSGFRKSITYIGDSDPIVDFLAPYNSFFLKSLFNQSCTSNMLLLLIIFTAMLFLLLSQYKRKDIILLLIIIIFIFFIRNDIQGDTNIYDFSIKHVEKMNTPHVENDSAYIVNALSKAGFVVTLQGNSNASKRLIITNDTMRINTSKENKNTPVIVFMKPKAVIMLNNKRYSISDIPLGTVKVLSDDIEYLIPDARNILVNGKIESPLARDQQYTFIGTASPQRFFEYERFIK